ncbi:MAG TPA: hypothetical protein GX507_11615 [Clostridia bacterium]|nr:hypothetical protein [Clostridia bacterium]
MITNLKPYPAYKDSGVSWLGEVPAHWELRRLRCIAEMRVSSVDKHTKEDEQPVRLCNYTDVYKNERISSAMVFMQATATKDEIERFRLKRGDVLITKDSEQWNDIGVPALVDDIDEDIVCGYHLALLRPFAEMVTSAYLLRALQSTAVAYQFHISANGITRYGLSLDAIKSVWLPLPPLPEQTAIVRFLDYMDWRIRRVIRARKKRISLLEEYKQALIHQAVTGKIDVRTCEPYPAYKPSGVEWLGQVPEHWEVRRLKNATHLIMGQSPPSDDCSTEPIGLPFLQGCAEFGHVHPHAKQFCRRPVKVSPVGAILVSVRAPVGRINVADQEYGIGRGLCAVVPVESLLDKTFVRYTLSASVDGLAMSSTGSTYDAVSVSDIGNHCLPLPPLPEQTAIVEYLDAQTAKIDAAISATRREIELLREYRTRLIADVVTGKVDVREVAAQLPEEPPEEEAELMDTEEIAEAEAADDDAAAEALSEEEVEP